MYKNGYTQVKIDNYLGFSKSMISKIVKVGDSTSWGCSLKVGKRRVIEFFIYPIIRYLDEGLSVR